ncbi:hypothetical protein SORBI_3002G273000 [Sorghum bicolor]|uniref:Uncharacterized protein n=2 Tax=Sorghum bicolor TaxID=4558 RepID=A0A1W0W5X6_SORBI|nr:hypothetical protein SORBI_3002G273000 [Sorghum bicolor]
MAGNMRQSSCLRTAYESCNNVRLGYTNYQSRILPQDLINELPEACIAEIFRHVENPEDRQSCASVCWRWANILVSQRPNFWGPFSVHQAVHPCLHMSNVDDVKLAAAVVDIGTRDVVTDLDLRCVPCGAVVDGVPRLTDSAIRFVTSACRNLKSVCLVDCVSLTDEAARIIASNCPALENLVMLQSSISDDGLSQVAKQCRNLKFLHIEGCLSITEASLRALVQYAKRLESLTLGSCPQIGQDAILFLLMNQPYLDKLELKGMMAGESHMNFARQSSALHHLCLFRQLSSLILVKCPGLRNLGMLNFARIHFRLLRHLVIDDCRGVTELGLMWLLGNAMNPTKLKTIKLVKFYFFTYEAAIEVMSLISRTIESIIMDSCDFGTMMPHYLNEAVACKCPKLKVISMEHCERTMELFLLWVNKVCRGLKELRLVGFPAHGQSYEMQHILHGILHRNGVTKVELQSYHLTDRHVCIVAQSCQGALQELILGECPNIKGNFVVYLRESCPNLIKLTLNHIQISDVQIRILMLVGFHHLEEFSLMECPWITDRLLDILHASTLPNLKRINLSGCPNVTQQAVDYYQRRWEIEY